MVLGIPYDSDQARAIAGALAAVMTGEAYATSAEMARELGPFPHFAHNREDMLRVIRNHRRAAYNAGAHGVRRAVDPAGGPEPRRMPGLPAAGGARSLGPGAGAGRAASAIATRRCR